jgi:hypothetical protein
MSSGINESAETNSLTLAGLAILIQGWNENRIIQVQIGSERPQVGFEAGGFKQNP